MVKVIYSFSYNNKYSLNKTNFYAYSFFDTKILKKAGQFDIDLDAIINSISTTIDGDNDEINNIRNDNHRKYYSIDIKFLREVGDRYKDKATSIIADYNTINSLELLKEGKQLALKHAKKIDNIIARVNLLKEYMTDDLMTIISYVDEDEKELDLTFLEDDNLEANKLKRKYNALVLHKSVLNLNNINLEMERQKQRLSNIRLLIPLVKTYMSNRNKYLNAKYTKKYLDILKNNLGVILSDYIFLLTHQEFIDVKKAYQGILNKDYTYIDSFTHIYKILLDKIWKYCLTKVDTYNFDFNYLICEGEVSDNCVIGLINRHNMNEYKNSGYIIECEGNLCDVFNISKEELLNMKLPSQINYKYTFRCRNSKLISIVALYGKNNVLIVDDKMPVVEIK